MVRVEAPKLTPATPSLPPHLPYQFDVLQSSHELLQHFKLFCDWAYRAFLSLKTKVPAVQWYLSTFIFFLATSWLQWQCGYMESRLFQGGIRTMRPLKATNVNERSVLNNASFHQSQEECASTSSFLLMQNYQFNSNDNTMSSPNSLLKGLVHDHVIYVFIYLLTASNLFNFIYLKFWCVTLIFISVLIRIYLPMSL